MSGKMQDNYTIQPGDTIAHCQVLRQIGISGIGAVYLVRHELLGDLRAMKILPAKQDQQGAVIRIVKEARTARILEHPNLVKILDAGLDKEKKVYYILFEYVDGCTLADILAKTRQINGFHALIIAEAITSVLIAFSEQGFVHRNIKPENIILSRLGKVKLANLGQVKNPSFDSVFLSGESMALISDYSAPEQISDFHSVDGRADIYSLGAVLYKMLIGTTDPTTDPLNILNRIRNQSLSVPEKHWNISPSIARLLMRMIALNRSDRPADAKELLKELQALKVIPPGTDREQSICKMISQAESGTYRLISLSAADIHTAQFSGLKTEVTRFWPVLLCVLVPLTWLAVKMFLPLLEEEDHGISTIRQP
ncbi:MAG: serine/threonine protein kinase, partial [Lentisphaeria bacterium]|nr:serine/threonine protein kinase [Lentisphaeria bacterium]